MSSKTYTQNQELIDRFKKLVDDGDLVGARSLYDGANYEVDSDVPLGRFGYEAIAYAKEHRFALPDHNVAWPKDFAFAGEPDSQPAPWVV